MSKPTGGGGEVVIAMFLVAALTWGRACVLAAGVCYECWNMTRRDLF